MDWNEAIEEERQAMKRFAALLLPLAVVAESLVRTPWALRCFILWLLRIGERRMLLLIGKEAEAFGPGARRLLQAGPTRGSRQADCLALGRRFRALARLYDRLAVRVGRLGRKRRAPEKGHISKREYQFTRLCRLAQLTALGADALGCFETFWNALFDRAELDAESWNSS